MSALTFKSTLSIEAFKASTGCKTIDVIINPKTSKPFFSTDNNISGAVSGDMAEVMANPAISEVVGLTGESFWMLHKKQSNNVVHTL